MKVRRGEVYYVDLGVGVGSEQNGERPCLIIQNDVGNTYSPTTIIVCLTTRPTKAKLPTHVYINRSDTTERKARFTDSLVLCEQTRTIDKKRLREKIAIVSEEAMLRVDKALEISIFQKK